MALDSEVKRFAAANVACPWNTSVLPTVGKPEAWRVSAGNNYPVASFGEPVVVDDILQFSRHRRRIGL